MRYNWLSVLFFLAAAPLVDFATIRAPWDDVRVMHTWDAVPADWECLGYPADGTTIDLYIALKPYRESALIDALYKVSDPNHSNYGAHLSREQVAELVAPHPETLRLVTSWLADQGVQSSSISTTHGGAWLTVTGVLVPEASQLLDASYQLYRHSETNITIIRTVGYALPEVLHTHIEAIAPTTDFAFPRVPRETSRRRSVGAAAAWGEEASGKLVPVRSTSEDEDMASFLRWMYNTFPYEPAATDENSLGILGFQDEYPSPEDLTKFMANFRTEAGDAGFTVVQVNDGGNDPSNPGLEASIDIQYAEAIAYPTPVTYYSTGGNARYSGRTGEPVSGDAYLEWLGYLIDQQNTDIPQTISVSYSLPERNRPPGYSKALCKLFAQLGTRGVSILIASGDGGVGRGDCNDDLGNVQFVPEFPSSCPWVTSVGGTTSYPELAAPLSGGGFSNYFPRPDYQNKTVNQYLKLFGDTFGGLYNSSGRGIPDISAQALYFPVFLNNTGVLMSGTSCSTPVAAGVISLLNDYLISMGRPPLGFLNIWLYTYGRDGLNDVTFGSNPGCSTYGYPATSGWDPVTGLGTPDFDLLQRRLCTSKRGVTFCCCP